MFWYGALLVAVLARLDFDIDRVDVNALLQVATIAATAQLATGIATGLYRGRRALASFWEVRLVVLSNVVATLTAFTVVILVGTPNLVPLSSVLAAGAYQLIGALGVRYFARLVVEVSSRSNHEREHRTLVFGAGVAGEQICNALLKDPEADLDPIAFLDDDPTKRRLRVNGIPVVGTRSDISSAARRFDADTLLLALPVAMQSDVTAIADLGQEAGLSIKILPAVHVLNEPFVHVADIRDLRLSDFLDRDEVRIDDSQVHQLLSDRRVLVTGAGGSIGSVLCRTILRYKPARLVMLDHDENSLQQLQLSIEGRSLLDSPDLVLCDIRDVDALTTAFEATRPDVVFHAAAHKHVTFLERFPAEAVKTNVNGTVNVLLAAAATGVERFINISTDKAADPISVLGTTKRTAERVTSHFDSTSTGRYLSVRFGNVLGSNGSAVPTFIDQINNNQPITITDPAATRYFMTVEEAVLLVLQAATLGHGGDVLVLDMGEPVSIDVLARRLARQIAPGREPRIVYTGLRPGEKLHEVLVTQRDVPLEQPHPRLGRYAVPPLDPGGSEAAAEVVELSARVPGGRSGGSLSIVSDSPTPKESAQ